MTNEGFAGRPSEAPDCLGTHIVEAAKRIYGAPEFDYYAIADGVRKLLTRFGSLILRFGVWYHLHHLKVCRAAGLCVVRGHVLR